jgi:KDO2-lipid IV(A) lauroyltransferase
MNRLFIFNMIQVLSRAIPRRLAYWIGLRIADRFYRFDRKGRDAVKANLRRVLEWRGIRPSEESLERMARKTFQNFAKYLVDFFRFENLSEAEIRRLVSIEHWEYLDRARALGKGVLVVTAHFGNWEMGACATNALGYPLHAVVLEQPGAKLNRLFQRYRRRRGTTPIPLGNAVRQIMQLLRHNAIVALLADRDYSAHNAQVDFFGAPASLPRGATWLAHRTGAPVLPGFMLRREDDTFLLRFHPPIMPGDSSPEDMHRELCRILEKEIGADPAQWMMFENIWDGKGYGQGGPNGECNSSGSVEKGAADSGLSVRPVLHGAGSAAASGGRT